MLRAIFSSMMGKKSRKGGGGATAPAARPQASSHAPAHNDSDEVDDCRSLLEDAERGRAVQAVGWLKAPRLNA